MANRKLRWEEDQLDRKQYADFLTTYIDSKCGPERPSLVIALDAAWGLGKTFFVNCWAEDLRTQKKPVVTFNAWENDSAVDPTIAFMAELRAGLRPLYSGIALTPKIKKAVQVKVRELVVNLRKSTMPALAIVGKGVLKKTTGIAYDELVKTMEEDDNEDETSTAEKEQDSLEVAPKVIEAALDRFFEKSLQSHVERMKSVKAFRQSLEGLLVLLNENQITSGPLYVFVDELDRCRPDYAIRLLEGIKHLFSVRGVVFVVSTNLDQLSKAVGAIYGTSFDGYSYLKRFFEFEYRLPEPKRYEFIKLRMDEMKFNSLQSINGLDARINSHENTVAHSFAAITEAFPLDLRSIQTVLVTADAAVTPFQLNSLVVAMWLFFLAALRHTNPVEFDSVSKQKYSTQEFGHMCQRVLKGNRTIRAKSEVSDSGHIAEGNTDIAKALEVLYEFTVHPVQNLRAITRNEDYYSVPYPNSLRHEVLNAWEVLNPRSAHAIASYGQLIAAAGHIAQ